MLQAAQSGGKAPPGGKVAKNQTELAEALGVTRKTIGRWMKLESCPGAEANGSYDVLAWATWAAVIRRSEGDTGDEGQTLSSLRIRNLLLQNQKLEQVIAIAGKQWVPVETVKGWGGTLGANIRKVVTQLHRRASSLVGLNLPETEAALKSFEDEILGQLSEIDDGIAEWQITHAESAQ